jgi:hypothetical protein
MSNVEQARARLQTATDDLLRAEALARLAAHPGLGLEPLDHEHTFYAVAVDGQIIGEVFSDNDGAAIGGWWTLPATGGKPSGPYNLPRQAAAALSRRIATETT